MKLPNVDRAIVELAKLREYCLSSTHPEGKHKARVFRAALGFTEADAERLREMILEALPATDATPQTSSPYGLRFVVDFDARGPKGTAKIRTAWILRNEEDSPRLTSCYVL